MGECCPAVRPEMNPFSSFLALPPSLLPREGAGQNALTGKGHPVLMVQGPKGHQGASEVHLPAATGILQFALTEALHRSRKGKDPALTAALQPVGEPAQSARMVLLLALRVGGLVLVEGRSAQTPASHPCATMAVSRAGLDVADQADQAEAELDSSWIKTSALS